MICLRCSKKFNNIYKLQRHLFEKKVLCEAKYLNILSEVMLEDYNDYYDSYIIIFEKKNAQNNHNFVQNCSNIMETQKIIKKYIELSSKKTYTCEFCGNGFTRKNNYINHKIKWCKVLKKEKKMNQLYNELKENYETLSTRMAELENQLAQVNNESHQTNESEQTIQVNNESHQTNESEQTIQVNNESHQTNEIEQTIQINNESLQTNESEQTIQVNNESTQENNEKENNENIQTIPTTSTQSIEQPIQPTIPHITDYGQEDVSNIKKEEWIEILTNPYDAIINLVKKLYIDRHENWNVYIPGMKEKYAFTFINDDWEMKELRLLLSDLLSINANRILNYLKNHNKNFNQDYVKKIRAILNLKIKDDEEKTKEKNKIKFLFLNIREKTKNNFESNYKKKLRKS